METMAMRKALVKGSAVSQVPKRPAIAREHIL